MNDVGFIFLMFFMVVGGTCSIALFVQLLQCCLLRFCDKKEKVSNLQIRAVPAIENPIAGTARTTGNTGTVGTTKTENSPIEISIEEDPKN
jgi:hypothetical protein